MTFTAYTIAKLLDLMHVNFARFKATRDDEHAVSQATAAPLMSWMKAILPGTTENAQSVVELNELDLTQ